MNIFVAKLSPSTTGEDLRELFSEYGEVTSANVIMDRDTGQSKRFGFVEMADDEDALKAIEELDDTEYKNSQIVVKKAKPKEDNGPRRSGGHGGGYNRGGGNRGGFGGGNREGGNRGGFNRGNRYQDED